jgi:hypothetical protein
VHRQAGKPTPHWLARNRTFSISEFRFIGGPLLDTTKTARIRRLGANSTTAHAAARLEKTFYWNHKTETSGHRTCSSPWLASVSAGMSLFTMLRIHKGPEGPAHITFSLSGRIQSEHVAELEALLESERRKVVLDLREVTLVSSDVVRFLGACESRGTELRNCPAYVRRWIARERCDAAQPLSADEG